MFHNTLDLVGLTLQPLLFQTESRLPERLLGLISTSPHKSLFLAVVMTDATEVRLTMLSSGWLRTRSLTRLAQSTEQEATIMDKLALP